MAYGLCACGMHDILTYIGGDDGLCRDCAGQPHPGRDSDGYPVCSCDECEAYWNEVCERSQRAADEWNARHASGDPDGAVARGRRP